MGGVEANALLTLRCGGVPGRLRLSRDWSRPNQVTLRGTRGTLRWDLSDSGRVVLTTAGVRLERGDEHTELPFEVVHASRTPEGWAFLEAQRRVIVTGPDAAAFHAGALKLRPRDMDRLWWEVRSRKGAGTAPFGNRTM